MSFTAVLNSQGKGPQRKLEHSFYVTTGVDLGKVKKCSCRWKTSGHFYRSLWFSTRSVRNVYCLGFEWMSGTDGTISPRTEPHEQVWV